MTTEYGAPTALIGSYNPATGQVSLSWGASPEGALISYLSPGTTTYTVDPLADHVVVTGIGAGGGGSAGACQNNVGSASGIGGFGGGGGAYAQSTFPNASLGTSVAVTVGAGGAGAPQVTAGNSVSHLVNPGSSGGNTSFGAFLVAGGGLASTAFPTPSAGGTATISGGSSTTTETGGSGGIFNNGSPVSINPGSTTLAGAGGGYGGPTNGSNIVGVAGGSSNGGAIPGGAVGTNTFVGSIGPSPDPTVAGGGGTGATSSLITGGAGGGGGGGASNLVGHTADIGAISGRGGDGGGYGGGGGAAGMATVFFSNTRVATGSAGGNGIQGAMTVLTVYLHGTAPHYLVYRNGAQIGVTGLGVTTFTDTSPPIGSDTYYVVASFDGVTPMSPLSNMVTLLIIGGGALSPGVFPPLGGAPLPSRKGLSSGTVLAIPDKWTASWYRSHINNVLANADTRNAISGPGISITGNITQPATISLTGLGPANPNFASGEVLFSGAAGSTTPGSQPATGIQASPNFQFGDSMPIPYTATGVNRGPAILLGAGGSGGVVRTAALEAGQATDAATAGNNLDIYAGYTQSLGTQNGGQLLLAGGGSFGGTGGVVALQGGPSTTGTPGVVRIQTTATALIDFQSAGQIFLYSGGGGAGTAGQVLTSGGPAGTVVWAAGGGGGGTTLSAAILADTPFAFWKCDDAGTKLADSSGNGFDLTTVNGTVAYQTSPLIPSLPTTLFARVGPLTSTGGVNGWGLTSQLGRTYPLTTWSAEFVFLPLLSSATFYRIIDLRPVGATTAAITAGFTAGTFELFYPSTGNNLTVASPVGIPLHVIITVSTTAGTSTVSMFVNGTLQGSFTAAASTLTGTMVMSVGAFGANASGNFCIGYIALFPTALSLARVAVHAAAAGKLGV